MKDIDRPPPHERLEYWDYKWRKGSGSARMVEISKREKFYPQEYCGRVYSLRDTNVHHRNRGHEPVFIGQNSYRFESDREDSWI